jgi:hypothetical protein
MWGYGERPRPKLAQDGVGLALLASTFGFWGQDIEPFIPSNGKDERG